jgi:hypothetical protein
LGYEDRRIKMKKQRMVALVLAPCFLTESECKCICIYMCVYENKCMKINEKKNKTVYKCMRVPVQQRRKLILSVFLWRDLLRLPTMLLEQDNVNYSKHVRRRMYIKISVSKKSGTWFGIFESISHLNWYIIVMRSEYWPQNAETMSG